MEGSDQYLWLMLPLVFRTLAEGSGEELLDRAQQLWAQDPDRIRRLGAVSARLDLVDRLRVDRIVRGQVAYADRPWREIDQLAAYLTITCIPIAEGAAPVASTEIFTDFLGALPDWVQRWLVGSYFLVPGTSHSPSHGWADLGDHERTRILADYWAEIAGRYPSTVDYVPWDWHDRAHLPQAVRDAPYEVTPFYLQGDLASPVEMVVGVPRGLAESEILRFLLVVRLRSWLTADDESFFDSYWARRECRHLVLKLLRELEDNMAHVHAWCANALHQRPAQADYAPLVGLGDDAARALLSGEDTLLSFLGLRPGLLQTYVQHLERVNGEIAEFNRHYEDPDASMARKAEEEAALFASVTARPETRDLVSSMETIHQELSRTLAASL